jgi:mono/diheme cytochrome c family protein
MTMRLAYGRCSIAAALIGSMCVAANPAPSGAHPLRHLASGQAATSKAASVLDGVFTAGQVARGQRTFQGACVSCHTVAQQTGKRFQAKWSGTTLGDLFDLISSTMPEGGPGSLNPDEYASVIAFLLKETGYPEGKSDLPGESAALMKVRIEPLGK